jgi:2,4-dienoyl-CoA reductase (NADPH2)
MGETKFEKLLEPGYIGKIKTRNRMIKSGALSALCSDAEFHMTEAIKSYYEAIAKGGVGLITVESPVVDFPWGARSNQRLRIDDDKYIKELSELPQVIHKHGCPTFVQFYHDGGRDVRTSALAKSYRGPVPFTPVGPSPVHLDSKLDSHNETPRELTVSEIEVIADKFVRAAVRAQKAGFDGVEINAASSHLLHGFLSPFWNRRQDAYGGNQEKRAKLLVDIIREIKKYSGKDFPVSVIINGAEFGQIVGIKNGDCLTLEQSKLVARMAQEAGADAIQVRSHWIGKHVAGFLTEQLFFPEPPVPLELFPPEYDASRMGVGANLRLAEAMKKTVSIPVITVGRLDPVTGEKALREGKADFIALHRRLMVDPELPLKVASGRLNEIAPCTACGTCHKTPRRCMVNAAYGKEYLYEIKKTDKKKKVLIVGGGPSGMETARVAALRGHDVILYEKTNKLGGLLPVAAVVKGLEIEKFLDLVNYLINQMSKLGVKTILNKEVNASVIEEVKPDVVVLAAGGKPSVPEIKGINNKKVVKSADMHRMLKFYLRFLSPRTLERLSKIWIPLGKRVVIIGGGIQGCELAEFLVKRGRKVTIVDSAGTLGEGLVSFRMLYLFDWFEKKGVTLMSQVKYVEITDAGLTIIDKEGNTQTLQADTIIPAIPLVPNTELLAALKGKVSELYAIGDCNEPRLTVDAIADGSRIAREI